jgi:hypothetical protein
MLLLSLVSAREFLSTWSIRACHGSDEVSVSCRGRLNGDGARGDDITNE